jgi:hypothetical protein
MRQQAFSVLLLSCLAALAACTATRMPVASPSRVSNFGDCPELEGYPDCQDGHQIDLRIPAEAEQSAD